MRRQDPKAVSSSHLAQKPYSRSFGASCPQQDRFVLNLNNLRFVSLLTETPNSSLSLAKDKDFDSLFVLKTISLSSTSTASELAELEFFTRQNSLNKNCENIISCFGIASLNKNCFVMALEFCSLGDFHYLLYEDQSRKFYSLDFLQRLSFIFQALNAIIFCHKQLSVFHGDIKSSNILLSQDMTLKLCDFGSSVLLNDDKKQDIVTSSGTIPYCAPEILFRKPHNFESDFWSFGVLATEILCFQNIFEVGELKNNEELVLSAICCGNIEILLNQICFPNLISKDFVRKLLERDQKIRLEDKNVLFHPIFYFLLNNNSEDNNTEYDLSF